MSHTDILSIRRALFQKRTNNIIVILFRFSVLGDAARLLMLKKSKYSKKSIRNFNFEWPENPCVYQKATKLTQNLITEQYHIAQ